MGFPEWEGADHCTEGPQAGVVAFAAAVQDMRRFSGIRSMGIYNCRTVRGGATTSLHGEGRAWDAGHDVGDPVGRELLNACLKRPGRLGIQCIIHERRIYSALSPQGRDYTGLVPHLDHLHIEFSWEAARRLTKATVLELFAPAPRTPGQRDLRVGCQGADVRWLQRKLELDVDGQYGTVTSQRVLQYERRHDFAHPNGVVNQHTWKSLGVSPTY